MAACGTPHPDNPELVCEIDPGNHRLCTGYDVGSDTYMDWENPSYEVPKTRGRKESQEHIRAIAARVAPDIHVRPADASANATVTAPVGIARGFAESARAAGRWDEDQKKAVLDAIIAVAKREDEFTTDAIWRELHGSVPVTKGMTALLRHAVKQGILDSTGKTEISSRGGEHDHGQRLTVWYSLIQEK